MKEELEKEFRRCRPAKVLAVCESSSGTVRTQVAMRRGQAKWRLAAAAVAAMSDVVSVEMHDVNGELVGAFAVEDAAPPQEELPSTASDAIRIAAMLREHTRDVVRDALTAQRELFEPTLKANTELVKLLCDRLTSSERDRQRLQVAHYEALTAQAMATAEAASQDPISPETKAVMAQVLPIALAKMMGPTSAPIPKVG